MERWPLHLARSTTGRQCRGRHPRWPCRDRGGAGGGAGRAGGDGDGAEECPDRHRRGRRGLPRPAGDQRGGIARRRCHRNGGDVVSAGIAAASRPPPVAQGARAGRGPARGGRRLGARQRRSAASGAGRAGCAVAPRRVRRSGQRRVGRRRRQPDGLDRRGQGRRPPVAISHQGGARCRFHQPLSARLRPADGERRPRRHRLGHHRRSPGDPRPRSRGNVPRAAGLVAHPRSRCRHRQSVAAARCRDHRHARRRRRRRGRPGAAGGLVGGGRRRCRRR